jgi:hypothetical protein
LGIKGHKPDCNCFCKDKHGSNNYFYGKHHTDLSKQKISVNHADFSGENNPMYGVRVFGKENPTWKNGASKNHNWIAFVRPKPDNCERCGKPKGRQELDAHSISNEHKKEIGDWIYVCRRCHQILDGRLEKWYIKVHEVLKGENNGMYGKHHTDECKRKVSEKLKGRIPWNKGKNYAQKKRTCFGK